MDPRVQGRLHRRDNYYLSFPNLYTLRGTEPRKALDYVSSLNTVLSWNPELLIPSHGNPLYGRDNIQTTVANYPRRHSLRARSRRCRASTPARMLYTLMQEIELPPQYPQSEIYGNLPWIDRVGIYEGYIGWFDGNVSNMYELPARSVYPDVVALAGGPEAVGMRAAGVRRGRRSEACHAHGRHRARGRPAEPDGTAGQAPGGAEALRDEREHQRVGLAEGRDARSRRASPRAND